MAIHTERTHHPGPGVSGDSLNRIAALATLHCLTGCAIGEVLGMEIGTALGFGNAATIALAVLLAFVFGYSLTLLPLVRSGLTVAVAVPLAFASDSFSIAVMELVDNGVMLAVPGAMDAPLSNPLFWGSLAFALAVAYVIAFPVNRYLIARGQGHAVIHEAHGHRDGADRLHRPEQATVARASARRPILIGRAAMVVTVAVAAGGALIVESDGRSPGHGPTEPDMPRGHGETGSATPRSSVAGVS
jgi:hypothetical protein